MKKEKAVFLSMVCLLVIAFFLSTNKVHAEETAISFFYYNACTSCNAEDSMTTLVTEKLLPLKEQYPYQIAFYNTFREEDQARYEKVLEGLAITKEEAALPLAVIGGRYASGYEEMDEQLVSMLTDHGELAGGEADEEEEAAEGVPDGNGVMRELREMGGYYLFTTDSCADCAHVKEWIAQSGTDDIVEEKSILEEENLVLLRALFAEFGVSGKEQQVPILFGSEGYAAGKEEIGEVLAGTAALQKGERQAAAAGGDNGFWQMFAVGLLNGLNPCALSMLFFFLSLMTGAQLPVFRPGIAYVAGKWCAYFAIGTGFFTLFGAVKINWESGFAVMKYIMLAAAVVLAAMNLLDYLYVKRKEYGKVRMQLPKRLRRWNHNLIKRVSEGKWRFLIPVVFILSVILSAGEFFCTGQIYAAALFLLAESNAESNAFGVGILLQIGGYVTALCLPSLGILLFVHKTGDMLRASDKALNLMPVIKLAYSMVFLGVAVLTAYFL